MRITILSLLIISSLPVAGQWKSKVTRIDSALSYLYEHHLFNGTVLLAEEGKVIYKKAFGIAGADGKPLTTSSAFNLASVSKQFFTMMAMILKEQGKLNFDDAVQKYLPGFPYPQITLRNLMNHTSGLPEYFEIAVNELTLLDTLTNESMLALLAYKKPPLVFKPGAQFDYCNTNYTTLASVIEKVSGLSSDKFFDEKIVKPLNLKNTYIYDLTMKKYPPSRVSGFHFENDSPVTDDLLFLDGIVGDGNVYSSVEDLLKWDQALYTEKLVSKATFKEAMTPAKLSDGTFTDYGFGWSIINHGAEISHSGGWAAFSTYIDRYIAMKKTFVILDNSANGYGRGIVKHILDNKPYKLPTTQLITNVVLVDGTGSPARKQSVRIVNDRIRSVGDLKRLGSEPVVDGNGKVLAPGFIDSHSHHEWGLKENPEAIPAVSQGITTIVVGQDGGSWPVDTLESRIQKHPVSVNIATYTGHGTLRELILKEDIHRKADSTEVNKMKQILVDEIHKGSLGLSSGLEYEDGFYSNTDEVVQLAKAAASAHGRYISHIRSEDVNIERALEEIITIGREAKLPVQISHFKIAMRSKWGNAAAILAQLDEARGEGINITADLYPYTMWVSTPRVLFPKKDFSNEASAVYATKELFDPSKSVMLNFPANKRFEGKTISEIGDMNQESAPKALLRVIREGEKEGATIAGASMSEDDVSTLLRWNYTNVCSDGSGGGHPRGYGAFTRILGKYVREEKLMRLETAINKMTGLTAEHLGISKRGLIARSYYADMVLFDPSTVKDNATMSDPTALSSGILKVWVNGQVVFEDQTATKKYPGVFVKGPGIENE